MSADGRVILTPDMARRIRTMLLHSCGPQQEMTRALEAIASGDVRMAVRCKHCGGSHDGFAACPLCEKCHGTGWRVVS